MASWGVPRGRDAAACPQLEHFNEQMVGILLGAGTNIHNDLQSTMNTARK